ncbi:hypothetical protein B0J11DRAFT_568956 [Dendryphion nanum]|uniref:Uncharacterized protein n=1 Tax=Dendryphion nanum TaxID=256645 RepID=A0A9P9DRI1_9PLEO|nr:hypothetical protein B0J11DRAFT_568956 [Dendryphion nanum]
MSVKLVPSQSGKPAESPLPYTGNPLYLCWYDVLLFWRCSWSVVGIVLPLSPWPCGPLDELYPSIQNLICLALHGFLIVLQVLFLASLPILVAFPVGTAFIYVAAVMVVNFSVSWLLNGHDSVHRSKVHLGNDAQEHDDEFWIYLNGVSVGQVTSPFLRVCLNSLGTRKHWLQGNLDRLALTFRRPITGVHNRTYGIIFDLIQCIIERNFCYATFDVRNSYLLIKDCLLQEQHKKVILILHSQGGIEGSLILDWLLSELPHDLLQKLEIYTFGSAANHFNNPHRISAYVEASRSPTVTARNDKAVRHIEHYATDGDFVARWGVLGFSRMENRYMGRVFIRSGMGHLLNQHYLNMMFPLGKDQRTLESNPFMDGEVDFSSDGAVDKARDGIFETMLNGGNGAVTAIVEDMHSPVEPVSLSRAESILEAKLAQKKPKVRDFSRLWEYRDGKKPEN